MNLVNGAVKPFGNRVSIGHKNTKFLVSFGVEPYRRIVAVFDHIRDNECVFTVTFRGGIVAVFLVPFDEMGIHENSLNALA
jgi:hypothetical protein